MNDHINRVLAMLASDTPEEAALKIDTITLLGGASPKFARVRVLARKGDELQRRAFSLLAMACNCVLDVQTSLSADELGYDVRVGTETYVNVSTINHFVVQGEIASVKLVVWLASQPATLSAEGLDTLRNILAAQKVTPAKISLITAVNEKFQHVRSYYANDGLRRIHTPAVQLGTPAEISA